MERRVDNYSLTVGIWDLLKGISGFPLLQSYYAKANMDKDTQYCLGNHQTACRKTREPRLQQAKNFLGPGGISLDVSYECSRQTISKKARNQGCVRLVSCSTDGLLGLPKLIKDVQASMKRLSSDQSGITDPFESIYRMVYQLTIRTVGCDDIADDPELLEKTLQLYETIEASATATTILFPKVPSVGIIKRTVAGGRLYMILKKIVDKRRASGIRGDDPLQYLMDEGDDMARIIEVCGCKRVRNGVNGSECWLT